jgi:hypothetical protein
VQQQQTGQLEIVVYCYSACEKMSNNRQEKIIQDGGNVASTAELLNRLQLSPEQLRAVNDLIEARKEKIIEEKKAQIKEIEAEYDAIASGTFYSSIDDVWEYELANMVDSKGCLEKFCRRVGICPKYTQIVATLDAKPLNPKLDRSAKGKSNSAVSRENSASSVRSPDASDGVSSGLNASTKAKLKKKRSGNSCEGSTESANSVQDSAIEASSAGSGDDFDSSNLELSEGVNMPDLCGSRGSSRGHLLPENPGSLAAHGVYCQDVAGFYVDDMKGDEDENKKKLLQLACGRKGDNGSVVEHGMVDLAPNFIRLPPYHRPHFDHNPCRMLIPLLTLEEAKGWYLKGGSSKSYWVLAISGEFGVFNKVVAQCPSVKCLTAKKMLLPNERLATKMTLTRQPVFFTIPYWPWHTHFFVLATARVESPQWIFLKRGQNLIVAPESQSRPRKRKDLQNRRLLRQRMIESWLSCATRCRICIAEVFVFPSVKLSTTAFR